MPVSWRISDGLVVIDSEGEATLAEWEAAVTAAVSCDAYRPGMGVLHDVRRWLRVPSADELRARVAFGLSLARTRGIVKWATVVPSAAHFGMGRMAETIVEIDGSPATFRVFKDLRKPGPGCARVARRTERPCSYLDRGPRRSKNGS